MKKNLYIFGCSGVGKSICDSIDRSMLDFLKIYFVDNDSKKVDSSFYGKNVISLEKLKKIKQKNDKMIFAFFKPHNIFDREDYINKIRNELNIDLISVIDSSAVISPTATIGTGTYIGPNVVLDSDAKIGKNNIILFNSIISREVITADNCFISAGCVLKGSIKIKESSFISANASIAKNINAKSFINAGLLLTEEINQSSIVGCSDSLVTIELPDDTNKATKRLKFLHP